ncbi:MAG: hypothetical protein K2I62_07815 [Alistipes sp.]|nr:hypothetical protein [Alistipes sp.]
MKNEKLGIKNRPASSVFCSISCTFPCFGKFGSALGRGAAIGDIEKAICGMADFQFFILHF